MRNGCLDQIEGCRESRETGQENLATLTICSEAQDMCRDNVEGPYYQYSGRGTYDIRHPSDDPTPPEYFADYLNQGWVQEALGVNLNYTESNSDVYFGFQATGDFVYNNFLQDLEELLAQGLRISLYYG